MQSSISPHPITLDSTPIISFHRPKHQRLPHNNRLHRPLLPQRRPSPQRRQLALPKTVSQNPLRTLQRLANLQPRQPIRLRLVHEIDNNLARLERFRVREAHGSVWPAAEDVGRVKRFSGEHEVEGAVAVVEAGFVEGAGAGVVRLDEAVGFCCKGGGVWVCEVEGGEGWGRGEELGGYGLEWSRGG